MALTWIFFFTSRGAFEPRASEIFSVVAFTFKTAFCSLRKAGNESIGLLPGLLEKINEHLVISLLGYFHGSIAFFINNIRFCSFGDQVFSRVIKIIKNRPHQGGSSILISDMNIASMGDEDFCEFYLMAKRGDSC